MGLASESRQTAQGNLVFCRMIVENGRISVENAPHPLPLPLLPLPILIAVSDDLFIINSGSRLGFQLIYL